MERTQGYLSSKDDDVNEIVHYGVSAKDGAPGRGSGRYPLGSGERPRSEHNPWIDSNGHVIKRGGSKNMPTRGGSTPSSSATKKTKAKDPYKLIESSIKQLNEAKALLNNESLPVEKRTKVAKQIAKVVDPKSKVSNIEDAVKVIDKQIKTQEKAKKDKANASKEKKLEANPATTEKKETKATQRQKAKAEEKTKDEEKKPTKEQDKKSVGKPKPKESAKSKEDDKKQTNEKKKSDLLTAIEKMKEWSDERAERKAKERKEREELEYKERKDREDRESRERIEREKLDAEREVVEKADREKRMKELAELRAAKRKEKEERKKEQEAKEQEEKDKAKKLEEAAERREWVSNPKKFLKHVAELSPEERQEFADIQRAKSYAEQQRVERITNGFAYLSVAKDGLFTALDTYDKVSSMIARYKGRQTDLKIKQLDQLRSNELRKAAEEYASQMKLQTKRYDQALDQDKALFSKQMERLNNTVDYEKKSNDLYKTSMEISNRRMENLESYEKSTRDTAVKFVDKVSKAINSKNFTKFDSATRDSIQAVCNAMTAAYKTRDAAINFNNSISDPRPETYKFGPKRDTADFKGPTINYPNLNPSNNDGKNKGGNNNNNNNNNNSGKGGGS